MNKRLEAAFEQICKDLLESGDITENDYITLIRNKVVWNHCRKVCADICENLSKEMEQTDEGNVYYNRSNAEFARDIGKILRPEEEE